ncbi:hypothetical protein GIY30_20970 [Gordonia sp. HNM0687]|uniref:Barstar (barnase inhibitor) domain-containing protein n=1 Tax=Gordonia mangrovi TaxID=2665643 RepID=A0A6L7GW57_9ACTN|nr:barstar family protein [Gordonia mangrovi]MXP23813.1 hypothetical protein [Gordonia mangrovi]UVF76373.1 barstar family protein [Gordonia mangrovi]
MSAQAGRSPSTVGQFLSGARRDGPVVGVVDEDRCPALPDDVRLRHVDGRAMPSISSLLDEFARAWGFPDHFGHNRDAFDDCMRDLDADAPTDGPPLTAVVTVVDHAESLLRREPDELRWFADSLSFYRDHYRDRREPLPFAVILLTPAALTSWVTERWRDAGAAVAEMTPDPSTPDADDTED